MLQAGAAQQHRKACDASANRLFYLIKDDAVVSRILRSLLTLVVVIPSGPLAADLPLCCCRHIALRRSVSFASAHLVVCHTRRGLSAHIRTRRLALALRLPCEKENE